MCGCSKRVEEGREGGRAGIHGLLCAVEEEGEEMGGVRADGAEEGVESWLESGGH